MIGRFKRIQRVCHYRQAGLVDASFGFEQNGLAFCDTDNDGDMDLFTSIPPRVHVLEYEITMLSRIFPGSLHLYENNGTGVFSDVTTDSLLNKHSGADQLLLFDYDNDQDLDIYLLVRGGEGEVKSSDGSETGNK